jgi:hypothetical protein
VPDTIVPARSVISLGHFRGTMVEPLRGETILLPLVAETIDAPRLIPSGDSE